ncbi:hydrophobin [Usnea florida]
MHFSTIVATALLGAAVTMGVPTNNKRNTILCPGTPDTPECCATDVLGVADLNCAPPPSPPSNISQFVDICAAIGQQAKCCFIPVLGQGLVCQSPP